LTLRVLLGGQPDVYQPYLILREHVIDRLYDQNIGYGSRTCKVSTISAAATVRNSWSITSVYRKSSSLRPGTLVADGKYEQAASLLESSGNRFEQQTSVANAQTTRLSQADGRKPEHGPVQIIIYSGKISEQTPQMASGK